MTLTAAAMKLLKATESGVAENADEPLRELNRLLGLEHSAHEIAAARSIFEEIRKVAYANRLRIVRSLQQLERSDIYSGKLTRGQASWEFAA